MPTLKEIEKTAKHRKGKKEFLRYMRGDRLTRGESVLAYCYECNGYGELKGCNNYKCPLWPYHKGSELSNSQNKPRNR